MSLQVKQLDLSTAILQNAFFDGVKITTQGKTIIGELNAPETDGNSGYAYMFYGYYNGNEYKIIVGKDNYSDYHIFKNGIFQWRIFVDYYLKVLPVISKNRIYLWTRNGVMKVYDLDGNVLYDGDYSIMEGVFAPSSYGNSGIRQPHISEDEKYLYTGFWEENDGAGNVVGKYGVSIWEISDVDLTLKLVYRWYASSGSYFYYGDPKWVMTPEEEGSILYIWQTNNLDGTEMTFLDWKNNPDVFDDRLKKNTDIFENVYGTDGLFYSYKQTADFTRCQPAYLGDGLWLFYAHRQQAGFIYDYINNRLVEYFCLPNNPYPEYQKSGSFVYSYHNHIKYYPKLKQIGFFAQINGDDRLFLFRKNNDQTALWQNQSLGGAGVINQINIKDNNIGVKKWFVKKSTDTNWIEVIPNKYYSNGILFLSTTETFDIKTEIGILYSKIKENTQIEEITVLFTPEINLPIVENLQITNETLTVSLAWDSNSVMNYHVQEAKATIAEWQTIATTTGTTFTITYTDPEQQQIPHYFRVLGVLNNGYTEPTNVVVAYPSQGGEENIYKYCNNQLLSILKNDFRLADIQEWLDYPPEKTTAKHKIVGWVTYRGEVFNQPVALGEREIWLSFEVGVLVKESNRNERFNSLTKPERKDYIFLIKEIIYEINNRSLNDYIYDIEIRDEVPYRHKDYHSIGIVNVIFKKRIRRL